MADETTTRNSKGGSVASRIVRGKVFSSAFFARHWLPVLIGVVVVLTYITGKYINQTRMETINKLNRELEIVKAERVRVRSEYMGRTCESSMQQLVDSVIPGLAVQDRPPYTVEK